MRRAKSAAHGLQDGLARLGLIKGRSFGLFGLDKKLLKYIDFRQGTFVEAGANDGLNQSNTAYFEKYLGWKGVLVEPIPELAEKCKSNRRQSSVYQCALIGSGDPRTEVRMTYCNLMSIVDGARGSQDQDDFHVQKGKQFLKDGDEPRSVDVPARTLDSILRQENMRQVDLLSLDVEGFEAQALLGLDFDRLAPTWILVEANDRVSVTDALKGRYTLIAELTHHDLLYRLSV